MILTLIILALVVLGLYLIAPRENPEHTIKYGAGQIALLAAVALFGVDYFTSFYYGTGELMSALHPYGLQKYGYIAVAVVAFVNFVLGGLYMYSLGVFNEGGGSFTASMRYLWPMLSVVVAVTLIQDYVFTIVVSALSGSDQLLSLLNAYGSGWYWHFLIGGTLATVTWFLTIRGRGESSRVVFTLLTLFFVLTGLMAGGLFLARMKGVPSYPAEQTQHASLGQALFHILVASMKGMVALTGLEAVSNGIQFIVDEDPGFVKWGKKKLPQLMSLWRFYSGKSGIARVVQTSFLFYGGLGTLFLTYFSIHFNAFDGTMGRTLVGNLARIGLTQIPDGITLYWAYQILAVMLLAAASMTAFQDVQSMEWRNVAIGVVPEKVVKRDSRGTFRRSVTLVYILALVIMFLVRGHTTFAIPFYGIGVFMPITVMGLAIRRHIQQHYTGTKRLLGSMAASLAALVAGLIFILQVVAKWHEGGWIALLSFTLLAILAHLMLLSPIGKRTPEQILGIVRQKARVMGKMAGIVEWQAFRMQLYRLRLLITHSMLRSFLNPGKIPKRIVTTLKGGKPWPLPSGITISGENSTEVSLLLYKLFDDMYATSKKVGEEMVSHFSLQQMPATEEYCVFMIVQTVKGARGLPMLALPIAKGQHGEVCATHVIEVDPATPVSSLMSHFEQGKSLLDAVKAGFRGHSIPFTSTIRLGTSFWTAVHTMAMELNANLLLIRTPSHPDKVSGFYGKEIDMLLHNPPCDIALANFEEMREPIRKILVPTSGSENCRLAAEIAAAIAKGVRHHVEIDMLYVSTTSTSEGGQLIIDRTLAGLGVPTRSILIFAPDVAEAILSNAEHYDLVIIGATRERMFENYLAGMVAEKVARRCHPPYIIARRKSTPVKDVLKHTLLVPPAPETSNPLKRLLRPRKRSSRN